MTWMAAIVTGSPADDAVEAGREAQPRGLEEPWLSFFEADEMEAVLRRAGFSSVEHFGREEATARYLRGRADGSRLPGYSRIAKATTGPADAAE
jgi:hypothetical protein